MILLLSGKEDQTDIVPIVFEGKLPEIARTLIVMFASIQHLVVRNMAENIKRQQAAEEKKVHGGDVQQNQPDASDIRKSKIEAPGIH